MVKGYKVSCNVYSSWIFVITINMIRYYFYFFILIYNIIIITITNIIIIHYYHCYIHVLRNHYKVLGQKTDSWSIMSQNLATMNETCMTYVMCDEPHILTKDWTRCHWLCRKPCSQCKERIWRKSTFILPEMNLITFWIVITTSTKKIDLWIHLDIFDIPISKCTTVIIIILHITAKITAMYRTMKKWYRKSNVMKIFQKVAYILKTKKLRNDIQICSDNASLNQI